LVQALLSLSVLVVLAVLVEQGQLAELIQLLLVVQQLHLRVVAGLATEESQQVLALEALVAVVRRMT